MLKKRGFLFPSYRIYGGLRGTFDYGPLGVQIKRNIENAWWKAMVLRRHDVVAIDTPILGPKEVWRASGHIENFHDVMVDCLLSKERFRVDKMPALQWNKSLGYLLVSAPDKATAKAWEKEIKSVLDGVELQRQGSTIRLGVEEVVEPQYVVFMDFIALIF